MKLYISDKKNHIRVKSFINEEKADKHGYGYQGHDKQEQVEWVEGQHAQI